MTNDLATTAPTLPGLFPDVDAAKVLAEFTTFQEGRTTIINREPTPAERQILQKRAAVLGSKLPGLGASRDGRAEAKQMLAAFFLGYPSLLNADAPGLVTAYVVDLQSVPIFALRTALDDIKHGRVTVRDKQGREMPLERDWPPASTRVYDQAVKVMHNFIMEEIQIKRVLGPVKLAVPELPPDERRRVIPRIQRMAQEARAALEPAVDPDEEADRIERAAARTAAQEESKKQTILAEYRRLGVEPVFAGDLLVSPEMVRRNNPGYFLKKDGTDEDSGRRSGGAGR